MKIGVVILSVGLIALCLALIFNAVFGVSESEFLSPSVWHLLWLGALLGVVGLMFLLPNKQDNRASRNGFAEVQAQIF